MSQYHTFVGLDVHKSSIAIAVAREGREPARFLGTVPNDMARVLRKLRRLGAPEAVQVCFEELDEGVFLPLFEPRPS